MSVFSKKHLPVVLLILLMLTFIVVELNAPRTIDWTMTLSKNDRIPFGNYVLFDLLPDLFKGKIISVKKDPVYNVLKNDTLHHTNYLFINRELSLDELDSEELLRFVNDGNTVFISAQSYEGLFADTLHLETTSYAPFGIDSIAINFSNAHLKTDDNIYWYKKNLARYFFTSFDTLHTTVLGTNHRKDINFIKVSFGKGTFFFNTTPLAFTNYYALSKINGEYLFKALSYLPVQDTFWDEYYKVGRLEARTPLRYILVQEPLRWAYYTFIFTIILFILFEGKRKQKIIPVITPLKNTTLEFVETVGRLYYENKDHKNVAEKKITYFLDYIRTHFQVRTNQLTEALYETVSEKSGIDLDDIKSLFSYIEKIRTEDKMSGKELVELNIRIDQFYNQTKR